MGALSADLTRSSSSSSSSSLSASLSVSSSSATVSFCPFLFNCDPAPPPLRSPRASFAWLVLAVLPLRRLSFSAGASRSWSLLKDSEEEDEDEEEEEDDEDERAITAGFTLTWPLLLRSSSFLPSFFLSRLLCFPSLAFFSSLLFRSFLSLLHCCWPSSLLQLLLLLFFFVFVSFFAMPMRWPCGWSLLFCP